MNKSNQNIREICAPHCPPHHTGEQFIIQPLSWTWHRAAMVTQVAKRLRFHYENLRLLPRYTHTGR